MTTSAGLRIWAHACLLAGGVLIIVAAFASALGLGPWAGYMTHMMAGSMPAPVSSAIAWWMGLWGFVTGSLILLAAIRVRSVAPLKLASWGTTAIVAGALSILGLGGWLFGSVLAILGGILAVASAGIDAHVP